MKLQDFKVESEAEDTVHLMHPSGRKFTVEKSKLSPKAKAVLQKMCGGGPVQKFDDGGTAQPASDAPTDYDQGMSNLENGIGNVLGGALNWFGKAAGNPPPAAAPLSPAAAPASDQAPAAATAPAVQQQGPAQPDPFAQYNAATNANLDTQMKAAQGLIGQMGASQGAQQQAWADAQKQMGQIETPEQTIARHHDMDAQFMQHLQDSKVDGNSYLKNRSTPSTILSSIALVLGGAGGGASGHNAALDILNNSINNDIEAQKADQSKTMNLWKMNRDATQDEISANLQTKNQLISVAQMKAAQAASNIQSAQGKFQITQFISGLQQQKNENNRQQGILRMSQQAGAPGGSAMNIDPSLLIPANANPAAKQKALDEIEAAQNTASGRDSALSAFDDLSKENTVMKTGAGMLRTPEAAARFRAAISPMFKDIENSARQQAIEAFLDHVSPRPGDFDSTSQGKRQAVQSFLDSKASAPTFKNLTGMDLGSFASTSANSYSRNPQLQRLAQIAAAHPNDPASQAFFKKYGSGGR